MPGKEEKFVEMELESLPGVRVSLATERSKMLLCLAKSKDVSDAVSGPLEHEDPLHDGSRVEFVRSFSKEESASLAALFFIIGSRGDLKAFQKHVDMLERAIKAQAG